MRNSRGEKAIVPTATIVEAIRRARITKAIGVTDKTTGQPAGAALFSDTRLRIVLDPDEVQAVMDMLACAQLEDLFSTEPTQEDA
jgi:hypothetical protein